MRHYADIIGVPFVEGGRDQTGLDCWGVVLWLYANQGIVLRDPFRWVGQADVKREQGASAEAWIAQQFNRWQRVDDPVVGCVVAFRDVDGSAVHVGVLVEEGFVVHALRTCGVVRSRLSRPPWVDCVMGYYVYCA